MSRAHCECTCGKVGCASVARIRQQNRSNTEARRESRRASELKAKLETEKDAVFRREFWSISEEKFLMETDMTAREAALHLRRTYASVRGKRKKMRRDQSTDRD